MSIGMSGKSTTSNIIISIEHLFVAYNRRDILHDVSMEIPGGVFLPLVGPNGSGKTTLLRAILGLIKPRKGRVRTTLHRSDFGYVPQHRSIDPLYPVSTREIVMMGLYPELGPWRRVKGAEAQPLDTVIARMGLSAHTNKTFGELSGGMKQKALIARALVGDSRVLALDEPTSELDEQSERDTLHGLLDFCRDQGKTVLLAHHGMETIRCLATELCLVNHGSIQLLDLKEAVHEQDLVNLKRSPSRENSR
jgi:ABC-type Mn2+/Zn2+ transport system ATPase subunit